MPTGCVMDALAKAPMNIVTVAEEDDLLGRRIRRPRGVRRAARGSYGQQLIVMFASPDPCGLWITSSAERLALSEAACEIG